MMKVRLKYLALFVLLTAVEVLIALFINDSFIRPYLGDVIVVWVVYCFVQIFIAKKFNSYVVCGGVCIFAVLVEFMQGINIVKILGLENSPFFRTLIGTHFDVKDIICYIVGCIIIALAITVKKHMKYKQ